jgi:hypothetical protein
MGSLIGSQITRSTVIEASRPRLTMPLSAALGVRTFIGRSCAVSGYRPVERSHAPAKRSELLQRTDLPLITDLSTTNLADASRHGSRKPFGSAGTNRTQGFDASMGADITTRLGSRPPSPPV